MADTGTTGQGQDPAGQGPQTGQDPAAQTQQQPQGQSGQDPAAQQQTQQQGQQQADEVDLGAITDPALRGRIEAALKRASEANQEAARYRTERNQFEQRLTEFQRANETEQQRAEREQAERNAELDRLRNENRSLRLGTQWESAAKDAKALDPTALLNLIGGLDKITLDENGKATNLDALLNEAKATYPWAFSRTAGADGGAGGGDGAAPAGGNMNDWIRGRR